MKLENTASLITGGSRGLGRALAIDLARRGSRVAVVARNLPELTAVVDCIRAEGGTAIAIAGDVADKRSVYPIVGQAAELIGDIDILVNNASTLGATPLRPLLDTECEDLESTLQTNLIGPFRLTRVVAGHMAARGRGVVINVSSDAAIEAYPTWGSYGVSKAALDHLSRIWNAELTELGVQVVSIDPGEMDTVMHAAALPDSDPSALAKPAAVATRIVELLVRAQPGALAGRRVSVNQDVAA